MLLKEVVNMSFATILGTVLLTIGITRLAEYTIFDRKRGDNNGTWKHDEDIPTVALEEV